jgi:hypothetical protein
MNNGTKVDVYFNLHKKCLSVRDHKTRRVSKHVDHIVLDDVKFKVSESGRQRVLREHRKNVHACVQGVEHTATCVDDQHFIRATYNPYKYNSFVRTHDESPIYHARQVIISGKNILVLE